MQQLFVSDLKTLRKPWQQAFGDQAHLLPSTLNSGLSSSVIYWLDWQSLGEEKAPRIFRSLLDAGARVVVMSASPSAEQAMQMFTQGARGYCHQLAAAEQLREIALVIEHGGIWLGSDAMKRLLRGTLPLLQPQAADDSASILEQLTPKERAVATEVARGASNREIASALSVSERTVKAHLSEIFARLGVRDRVQLALRLNNVSLK